MPRCLGGFEEGVHISDVTYIVEGDNPPVGEMGGGGAPTDVDRAVAKLIVEEIPDGACLQLGIGGMPNTVGSMIAESDLKDLGVHTEMYVDAFVDISKAGKITGAHKNIDKGRQVYAFGAGTKKLYDFLNENPSCMSAPVNYTNDVRVSISPLFASISASRRSLFFSVDIWISVFISSFISDSCFFATTLALCFSIANTGS